MLYFCKLFMTAILSLMAFASTLNMAHAGGKSDAIAAGAELIIEGSIEIEKRSFTRSGGLRGLRDTPDNHVRGLFHKLPNSNRECLTLYGTGYVCEAGKFNDANCGSCCLGANRKCTDYKRGQW